jgi:ankyrin repeat protein
MLRRRIARLFRKAPLRGSLLIALPLALLAFALFQYRPTVTVKHETRFMRVDMRLFEAITDGAPTEDITALIDQNPQLLTPFPFGGTQPIHKAAAKGRDDVIRLLVGRGIDANAWVEGPWADRGYTPLLYAIAGGHTKAVKALLELGADPNLAHLDGETPLMYAKELHHSEIADLLRQAIQERRKDKQ